MYLFIAGNGTVHYPLGAANLRELLPSVSLPSPIPAEGIPSLNIYPLHILPPPEYDTRTQTLERSEPRLIDNQWTLPWEIVPLTAEQIAERTDEEAQHQRNIRDGLLLQSDWTQLADSPVDSAAWAVYRQALRDVPQQAGFPWDVIWPVQPT